MGCFPCSRDSSSSSSNNNRKNIPNKNRNNRRDDHTQPPPSDKQMGSPNNTVRNEPNSASSTTPGQVPSEADGPIESVKARTFTLAELVSATESFKDDNFLGEGGFGRVYKGRISTGETVAIKKLDRSGGQGISEFVVEVITLSSAHHNNLVKLIGFCAEGDQRLLVYEYMPLGALDDHIHEPGPEKGVMDWNTRMKIAAGAAKGLEYLHTKMTPAIIYRDLKCSNILLGPEYHPKLSDFGLAKVGPQGDATHVSTRVMGTYGYCAPEYAMTGQLTYKSDLFSFGVVLLELITGRRAIDNRRPKPEQNLVAWARPLFKDRKKFQSMVDPALKGQYPVRGLYQALAIAAMCVQEQPSVRPNTADIVTALTYLASQTYDPNDIITPRSSPSSSASTSRRISKTQGDQKSEEGKCEEEVEQNNEEGKAKGDQNPEEGEAIREEVEQKREEGEKQSEENT